MLENIYVSYQIQTKGSKDHVHSNIQEFIALPRLKKSKLIASYMEVYSTKKTFRWEQLQQAIAKSKHSKAVLIIAELGSYPQSDLFAKLLIDSQVNFYCCDMPFVNSKNIGVINQYLSHMRTYHGEKIKKGLKNTPLRSGNPNAALVIKKINKPKINVSILFALMLNVFVAKFKKDNLSQRQMCKKLNEIGFMAPEGGIWVLSQFQKIIKRINLNNLAYSYGAAIKELKEHDLDIAKIVAKLKLSASDISWDPKLVDEVYSRYLQLLEINNLLEFISVISDITRGITSEKQIKILVDDLRRSGLNINNNSKKVVTID